MGECQYRKTQNLALELPTQNMNILITGGCGYKGSVLIPLLLADGHNVTSVDTQWFGNALPYIATNKYKLDIRETEAIPMKE